MWNNGWSNQNVSEDAAFLGFFIKIASIVTGKQIGRAHV